MAEDAQKQLRAYVEYFRDIGVYDFYRTGEPGELTWPVEAAEALSEAVPVVAQSIPSPAVPAPARKILIEPLAAPLSASGSSEDLGGGSGLAAKLVSFDALAPLPEVRVAVPNRAEALQAIQDEIGDCTRCPLAYAGRRKIVYGDGDPAARLMFVGEGPGADEDESGLPFVGKAGQLLNNMIQAMGLKREEVYIANIVKCRPPANRVPEPVEANTCTQFLLRQMDVVQPQVVVALGATAAAYLLGVKQPLAGLRGKWHSCRGAKLAVTYHPAFLLRDPRQKGEAWKDLQMVMAELGLKGASK
jgi:uracil-DNA glycosylase family 4